MSIKKISAFSCFLLLTTLLFSQGKVSVISGNWSNPLIWLPAGVPSSTNDVTIANGTVVDLDMNGTCNSINIGTGGTLATFRFVGNVSRLLTVSQNFSVSGSGSVIVTTSSNKIHTLTISGNVINQGSLNFYRDPNSAVDLICNRNGNQFISGTGTLSSFSKIQSNLGTSNLNILEISVASFSVPNDFLTLTNGTVKFSSTTAATLVPFLNQTTVSANAGIWMNSPTSVLSTSAGIINSGLLRISSGTIIIGNAANEDLATNGGTLNISGGSVFVAGKYFATVAASTFSLSGGSITLPMNGSTSTIIAPLHFSANGSTFVMSDGTICIRAEGGAGPEDLGYVNTLNSGVTINGGTLQIGYTNSPASQSISINSTQPVPNLVVNSASITAKLATNSLSILNAVTISSGTLNSGNLDISLAGNWNDFGSFVPGNSIVTFNSSTSQSIFRSGGETFNHLRFAGSGIKSFSSNIAAAGNFSIASGTTVDVSVSNYSLSLNGHFLNDGTFVQQRGTVLLTGTSNQSIAGNSSTTFYHLSLNNAAGAVLANATSFEGTLLISNGVLNVNSQVFTLVSNSSNTGRIGPITGSGNITGNVVVQRFIPGGSTGWALIGSPIASGLTLNDWDDDLIITCATCPDGSGGGFLSVYSYDETQPGIYDDFYSYVPINSINDALIPGKGYWVYTGTGPLTSSDIVLDVTGAVRKFNYTIPLNYTNFGSPVDDGWNLIMNPYPSPISWNALRGLTTNIDNAIYVYNADLNGGVGSHASFVNGVSSPAVSSGGIDDNIPMGQGFYVHSTGATALSATENIKVNANPTFLKSALLPNPPLLRLHLKNNLTELDETVLYFESGATKNFEPHYDAYKMTSAGSPVIAFHYSGKDFQINAVSPISGSFSIPLKTISGASSNFTLSASNFSSFPFGTCIELYDTWTSQSTNLKTSEYSFYLPDTTTVARFELHIQISPLLANSQLQQPSCRLTNDGSVCAKGLNQGPWNYMWTHNGQIVKTSFNQPGADTLKNLSSGIVELEINSTGQCDNYSASFFVVQQQSVSSHFTCPDTLVLPYNAIQPNNLSLNAASYYWDSGQNDNSTLKSPLFYYQSPGEYKLMLYSSSATGCVDSAFKNIVVLADPTTISKNNYQESIIIKTLSDNHYELQSSTKNSFKNYALYNQNSTLLHLAELPYENQSSFTLNLEPYPSGIYYVKVMQGVNYFVVKLIAK